MEVNPKSNPKSTAKSKPNSSSTAKSGPNSSTSAKSGPKAGSKPVRSKRPKIGDKTAPAGGRKPGAKPAPRKGGKPAANKVTKPSATPAVQKATPARRAALDVISEVRRRDAYAHEVMSAVLSKLELDSREAGFATRLAYGVIATRGALDSVVRPYLDDPKKTQPEVLDALALSTYELLFEGTESHVAVSQGVDLVRSVVPRAAGLSNAILRKVAANLGAAGLQTEGSDPAALARRYGHPEWLAELFVERFGPDLAEDIMDANNQPAPIYLAQLPWVESFETTMASLTKDGVEPEPLELAGVIVANNGSAAVRSGALARGAAVVADGGAQLAVWAVMGSLDRTESPTILDIGSGRGTKSFIMAASANRAKLKANIVGVELHTFKVEAATVRAEQLTAPDVTFVKADATMLGDPSLSGVPASADAVLVDAPCTGLGTLRRHPDRRWRATREEVGTLAELDLRLLEASSARVATTGTLVYSTCTMTREENEGVVERFLAGVGEGTFELAPFTPDELPEIWSSFVTPDGYFQSVPLAGGIDGHFIARLKRIS